MASYLDFAHATLEQLVAPGGHDCACGRHHSSPLRFLRIGAGAVSSVPEALSLLGCRRPFVVCDTNTHAAAWPSLGPVLERSGVAHVLHVIARGRLEPDEQAVGELAMAFDRRCDCVLAVGSGVVNDCCKVLARTAGVPSAVVCTAPSMDGYASDSASMVRDRVKVSLACACPAAVIADTDIVRLAPMRMLWAGLGDMLAKSVALCEWRVAHAVTGEHYCANVAALMRASLAKVVASARGLAAREPAAVEAAVEGLVLSGVAMCFAQCSRPASGLEHYFSHIWEMMALERGLPCELHGIQVGVGTYLTLRLYERAVPRAAPDSGRALAFVRAFSNDEWERRVRETFGKAADVVIEQEHRAFHKNEAAGHARRLANIVAHWGEIVRAMDEELPPAEQVGALMRELGMPVVPEDIGIAWDDVQRAFIGSRDIRDKYLTSSLLWDLGLLHEVQLPRSTPTAK
eukprot:m51a1_g6371 putative glycerol-1-phosphate dehydrogenase (459) ;mRNA; r:124807-126183